jgi:hypothetical protein
MKNYYVNRNAQPNGDHEVHTSECAFLPKLENRFHLGYFFNCHLAVAEASKYFVRTNGCKYCCMECHTT